MVSEPLRFLRSYQEEHEDYFNKSMKTFCPFHLLGFALMVGKTASAVYQIVLVVFFIYLGDKKPILLKNGLSEVFY